MYSLKLFFIVLVIQKLTAERCCVCKDSIPTASKSRYESWLQGSASERSKFVPKLQDRSRTIPSSQERSRTVPNSPDRSRTQPAGIPNAISGFSFKLYNALSRSSDKNLFYSPVGIVYAFSMLMLGASDASELEVFHGLHLNESFRTPDEAHKAFRGLLKHLRKNENYSLDLANILLIQKDERFLKEYTKRLGNFYKVAIGEVDFLRNGRQVMKDINDWVANNTHDQIKSLLRSPLDPLTKLVIVNAVYFKGKWLVGFDKEVTSIADFYNHGKIPKQVPFMHNTAKYGYYENKEKKYQILELKYFGDVSFFIVLPTKKDGLDELMNSVDINEYLKPLDEVKVEISVPRITLQTEYDLKKVLPEVGIKAIFGPGANLSGISGDKTLFVSTGIHKSMIKVDEEGTEASSASGLGVGTRNYQDTPTFNANHPFMFFIRHTKYGIIYFMGRVNEF